MSTDKSQAVDKLIENLRGKYLNTNANPSVDASSFNPPGASSNRATLDDDVIKDAVAVATMVTNSDKEAAMATSKVVDGGVVKNPVGESGAGVMSLHRFGSFWSIKQIFCVYKPLTQFFLHLFVRFNQNRPTRFLSFIIKGIPLF